MAELTTEELITKGLNAAHCLADVALMGFISEMAADALTCIGNSEPEHHKERNQLYYEHRALNDLVARLRTYRDNAETIMAAEGLTAEQPMETD